MAGGQELRQGQCDWTVHREEDKGDNEAGGQIMPDLVGHVKDFVFYLKADLNPFKRFLQSWWGWSGLEVETQSGLYFGKIVLASMWRTNQRGPE